MHDPLADHDEVFRVYNVDLVTFNTNKYDVIVLAAAHTIFVEYNITGHLNENGFIYDLKNVINEDFVVRL